MIEERDPILAGLRESATPPLPAACRARTLAIARTNLPFPKTRHRSQALADYMPPVSLVPSLLISAAAVFVFDAFLRIAYLFWMS